MPNAKHKPDCEKPWCVQGYLPDGELCTCSRAKLTHNPQQMVRIDMLTPPAPTACPSCGQTDKGQTGEYPCPSCGLPRTWDPPAPTAETCAICEHEHKLCGPPPCNYTPKAPTAEQVREARENCELRLGLKCDQRVFKTKHVRTLLAALDKAQGDAGKLAAVRKEWMEANELLGNPPDGPLCEMERQRDALRDENARLGEELRIYTARCEDLYTGTEHTFRSLEARVAAQAEQIKRLREVAKRAAPYVSTLAPDDLQAALKEASK